MNKYLAGAAIAAVAIGATPAAAEAPSGPRVELIGGADILRQEIPGITSPTVKLNDTGILYGIGAGFDFPVTSGISLGIEGEITDSTAELEKTFLGDNTGLEDPDDSGDLVDVTYQAKPKLDAYVGGRISFSLSDVANAYIKAGYTRLSYRADISANNNVDGASVDLIDLLEYNGIDPDDVDFDSKGHVGGYRIGAGAQVSFWTNAYLGGEVAYSNYSDDIDRYRVAMMVGYRFGGRREVVEPYVAPPAPPAPEPAPATITCPDGSVILATETCPVAPPPPAPERG